MKICIDARWIKEKIAGIGRYTVYLLRHLPSMEGESSFLVLFDDDGVRRMVNAEIGLEGRPNVEVRMVPYGVFSARGLLALPRLLRKEGVDIFHSTNFMAPLSGFGGRLVLTIHDLIPLKHPEYAPRSRKSRFFLVYKALMNRLVTIADAIVTDSEYSRRDILESFRIPPGKVRTVYLGVDPKYRPLSPEANEEVRRSLRIRDRMAVYAGRGDPYKNLMSLVRAVQKMNAGGRIHCTVVVAGEKDPRYPEVEEYIASARMKNDVVFAGSQDEDGIIGLYNAADLLVHPSLYEGFGLPPLEAMACGTPVISSNRTSLPEVVGDAGILLDPTDVDGLSAAMERILTDAALRARMREAGLERARLFPWRKTAEKTLAIYRDLCGIKGTADERR